MEKKHVAPVSERRESPRIRITQPVILNHVKLGTDSGYIENVSLNGAFIRSEWNVLPAFTAVQITVTLSSGEQRTVREYQLPATVTRCTKKGIGVQFDRLDMESYGALLKLVFGN